VGLRGGRKGVRVLLRQRLVCRHIGVLVCETHSNTLGVVGVGLPSTIAVCVCVLSFNSHSKSVCEGVRDWSQSGLAINMCVHACVCVCVCMCMCAGARYLTEGRTNHRHTELMCVCVCVCVCMCAKRSVGAQEKKSEDCLPFLAGTHC